MKALCNFQRIDEEEHLDVNFSAIKFALRVNESRQIFKASWPNTTIFESMFAKTEPLNLFPTPENYWELQKQTTDEHCTRL